MSGRPLDRGPVDRHEQALALVAASLDFRLSPEEQHALREHLAGCASCATAAARMRQDAAVLAAMPPRDAPAAVRDAVVRAAASRRGTVRPALGFAFGALALVVALTVGTFAIGALQDHRADHTPTASVFTAVLPSPTAEQPTPRPTLGPTPRTTQPPTPRPTPKATPHATPALTPVPTPTLAVDGSALRWTSLGELSGIGSRPPTLVLGSPGGGFVAFAPDRTSGAAQVYTSDDGVAWQQVSAPADVFGGRMPTSGGAGGPGLVVVGWDVSPDAGTQRAIWTSANGRDWTRDPVPSGLLGMAETDVRFASGPAGMLAWTPTGKAWFSTDARAWRRSTLPTGATDVLVREQGLVAVGRAGGDLWIATSANGRAWTEAFRGAVAGSDDPGAEAAADGSSLVWVGTTRYTERADGTWQAARAGSVPDPIRPDSVAGGANGFLAIGAAGGDGLQQGFSSSSGGASWQPLSGVAPDTSSADAARSPIDIVPDGSGWTVFFRAGNRATAWRVQ